MSLLRTTQLTDSGRSSTKLRSPFVEKLLQELGCLRRENTFHDFHPVIEKFGISYPELASDASKTDVPGSEHEAPQASVNEGARAHSARLQGHIQGSVAQPVISCGTRSRPKRDHFRMRGGVVRRN